MRTEERNVRYYQFYEVGEMTRAKVLDADKRAQEAIKQAQDLIEWLKAHRVELAERNKAIKEFNDLKKRLPNQEYILDIEKGPWE